MSNIPQLPISQTSLDLLGINSSTNLDNNKQAINFDSTDISVYIFMPYLDKYNKLGSLKMLSWGTQRSKAMVSSLGKAAGVGYTRGVRIVTGVLEFLQLDRSAFTPLIHKSYSIGMKEPYSYTNLADELPPFDLLLCYINEFGYASYRIIKHVEIVAGQGIDSIDNGNPSEIYSFVALGITPLLPLSELRNKRRDIPLTDKVIIGSTVEPDDTGTGTIITPLPSELFSNDTGPFFKNISTRIGNTFVNNNSSPTPEISNLQNPAIVSSGGLVTDTKVRAPAITSGSILSGFL